MATIYGKEDAVVPRNLVPPIFQTGAAGGNINAGRKQRGPVCERRPNQTVSAPLLAFFENGPTGQPTQFDDAYAGGRIFILGIFYGFITSSG